MKETQCDLGVSLTERRRKSRPERARLIESMAPPPPGRAPVARPASPPPRGEEHRSRVAPAPHRARTPTPVCAGDRTGAVTYVSGLRGITYTDYWTPTSPSFLQAPESHSFPAGFGLCYDSYGVYLRGHVQADPASAERQDHVYMYAGWSPRCSQRRRRWHEYSVM